MNNNKIFYIGIVVLAVLISSCSQIILKYAAGRSYKKRIQEYVNPLVMGAYALFFLTTFLILYALKYIPLSLIPVIEASGYVFAAVLGRLFLREKLSITKALGLILIIGGIIIFSFSF